MINTGINGYGRIGHPVLRGIWAQKLLGKAACIAGGAAKVNCEADQTGIVSNAFCTTNGPPPSVHVLFKDGFSTREGCQRAAVGIIPSGTGTAKAVGPAITSASHREVTIYDRGSLLLEGGPIP